MPRPPAPPFQHTSRPATLARRATLCSVIAILLSCTTLPGCTSPRQWIANGLKVGPEYCPPDAPVAEDWIDSDDRRVLSDPVEHAAWWMTFHDPVLNGLVERAYQENLTLREAGFRILEARALRGVAAGNFFPQQQQAAGSYSRIMSTGSALDRHFSSWNGDLNLAWEIDFWGRFRRAVEAADADLDASVDDYGDVLVTLVADVATTYVDIRTLQRRLELVKRNVVTQRRTYDLAEELFQGEVASDLDVQQAKSNLAQTEAIVPQLQIGIRQAQNRLCVLLGMPPVDLNPLLGEMPIPVAPVEVAVGIPAEALLRRPDVRRAERLLAAQSARIGIAESEYYPQISVTGTIGVTANEFQDLFLQGAAVGSVGPSFRWNVLNYGRIANNVRAENALFEQLLLSYQQSVLVAAGEVENALVFFLRSQQRLRSQEESAEAAQRSNELIIALYQEGNENINRVFTVQNFVTQQELAAAQAKGDVAQGLIDIYRALGGGWHPRMLGAPQLDSTGQETEGGPGWRPGVIPEEVLDVPQDPAAIPGGEPIPAPLPDRNGQGDGSD